MNNEFLLSADCETIRKQKPKQYFRPQNDDSDVTNDYERSKKIDKWMVRVMFGVIPFICAVCALLFGPEGYPVVLAMLGAFIGLMSVLTLGLLGSIILFIK